MTGICWQWDTAESKTDMTPAFVESKLCWNGNVSSTMKKKKSSFGCEWEWNLVSRAGFLASRLHCKVSSWIRETSVPTSAFLSFSTSLSLHHTKANVLLSLPVDVQTRSEQRERWNLRSDICLTYTKLPSRQEKLSCFFFFFFPLKARQSVLPLSCLDFEILNWSLWKFWVGEPK